MNYENTLKPPVPTPRKCATKSQGNQEDQGNIDKESTIIEVPESKKDTPPKVIKLYRKQKVIGKFV